MIIPRKLFICSPKLLANFAVALFLITYSEANAQRNLKEIPNPDPAVEKATFIVPEGFEVNLYASDPQLAKPIHMNFDAQGQLWVASSEVYPHIKPGQSATDKIIVLKDTTGDDRRQATVFVDHYIPTGVVPEMGVYVALVQTLFTIATKMETAYRTENVLSCRGWNGRYPPPPPYFGVGPDGTLLESIDLYP